MIFEIRNRGAASQFQCTSPWAGISIASRDGTWPEISSLNRLGILRLHFFDIANPAFRWEGVTDDDVFNTNHANQILEFYKEMEQQGIEVLMAHCEAGISRSAGVIAALSKIVNDCDQPFFERPYCPNMLVYRKILESHYEKQ